MKSDTFLLDANHPEERFRIKSLLHSGEHFQIALAEDTAKNDAPVCIKAVLYDAEELENLEDDSYITRRRQSLHKQKQWLQLANPHFPQFVAWLEIEDTSSPGGKEPVLVYAFQEGEDLYDIVTGQFADGMPPTRALAIVSQLAQTINTAHSQGYVLRNCDPRHLIVGKDDALSFVGLASIAKMSEPLSNDLSTSNMRYVAPEIRSGESDANTLRPEVDIYSLGALLSFLLTGEAPQESVENPLSHDAFMALSNVEPPGLGLLIAKCLQPLPQKRFASMSEFLKYCDLESLPETTTEGFGVLHLPAPWSGAESPDTNRALRSQLSAGPLLSVENLPHGAHEDSSTDAEPNSESPRVPIGLIMGLVLLAVLILSVILRANS